MTKREWPIWKAALYGCVAGAVVLVFRLLGHGEPIVFFTDATGQIIGGAIAGAVVALIRNRLIKR